MKEYKKMLLVKYKETDEIKGIVKDEKSFNNWLKKHNQIRKAEGEIKEHKSCFSLSTIEELD